MELGGWSPVFLQLNHRGAALSIRKGKGPDEFNVEEIEILIEAFAHAARQAQEAGEFVSLNGGWQPHFYGAIFITLDTLSLSPSRSKGLAITPLKPYRLKSEKIGSLE